MRGSIRKRGGRYYYSFDLATVDGKRKKIERAGGRTKKEAEAALRAALQEYERSGQHFDEQNMSVSDYMDYWYENYVMVNLKFNTQEYYKRIIDLHIKPAIGIYKLNKITPAVLQKLVNSKHQNGYSKNSVKNMMGVTTKAFKMAVYPYQFLKQDPSAYLTLPRFDEIKKVDDLKIITKDDFKRILERFPRGSSYFVPLQIAFNTGLRASEVCGLTWDNIDLINKTLTVDKILVGKGKGVFQYGTPKTKSSYRTINISDYLVKVFKNAQKDQKKNQWDYQEHYIHTNAVCTKENGQRITTDTLKYLSRVVNYELMIPFNFHSLRHTHASMLLEAGANIKAIQKRLGHSRIATTMDTYSHITKKLEESTKSILNSIANFE